MVKRSKEEPGNKALERLHQFEAARSPHISGEEKSSPVEKRKKSSAAKKQTSKKSSQKKK